MKKLIDTDVLSTKSEIHSGEDSWKNYVNHSVEIAPAITDTDDLYYGGIVLETKEDEGVEGAADANAALIIKQPIENICSETSFMLVTSSKDKSGKIVRFGDGYIDTWAWDDDWNRTGQYTYSADSEINKHELTESDGIYQTTFEKSLVSIKIFAEKDKNNPTYLASCNLECSNFASYMQQDVIHAVRMKYGSATDDVADVSISVNFIAKTIKIDLSNCAFDSGYKIKCYIEER